MAFKLLILILDLEKVVLTNSVQTVQPITVLYRRGYFVFIIGMHMKYCSLSKKRKQIRNITFVLSDRQLFCRIDTIIIFRSKLQIFAKYMSEFYLLKYLFLHYQFESSNLRYSQKLDRLNKYDNIHSYRKYNTNTHYEWGMSVCLPVHSLYSTIVFK